MHKVIKNILARKNQQAPFSDGRKIALVIYGGTMSAIRTGGALIALEEMGVSHIFDSIYTVSSGFPTGSYFLTNQSKVLVSALHNELASAEFLNFFRLWKILDTDYLIDLMKNKKKLDVKKMLNNPTKLYAGLFDPKKNQVEYLEIHDYAEEEYFDLLRASISVPYLCPGDAHVRGVLYEDMPFKQTYHLNHLQKAMDSGATDILVFYNYYDQRKFEGKLPSHVYEIRPPVEWQLSRFETRPEILKNAALQMGKYTKQIFGQNGEIKLN